MSTLNPVFRAIQPLPLAPVQKLDLVGRWILSLGNRPSASVWSRWQKKTARLFGQPAPRKRIGCYCGCWLLWAGLGLAEVAVATPCVNYGILAPDTNATSSVTHCYCGNSGSSLRVVYLWPTNNFSTVFTLGGSGFSADDARYCVDELDIQCSTQFESIPTAPEQVTLYFRNLSEPSDYWQCVWDQNNGFVSAAKHLPPVAEAQPVPTLQWWGLLSLVSALGVGLAVVRKRKAWGT